MKSAFTLVELIATLAFLAVLGSVSGPYIMTVMSELRVNAAVRRITSDLRHARAAAVRGRKPVFLQFRHPNSTSYTVAVDVDGSNGLSAEDKIVAVVDLQTDYEGVEFASGWSNAPADGISFPDNRARFTPTGTATSGSIFIRPSHDASVRRDRERRITVLGSTGRVRAYSWEGGQWL